MIPAVIKTYRLCAVVLYCLCAATLCAESAYVHELSSAMSVNTQKGIESNVFYFDAMYRLDSRQLRLLAGLQCTSANTDFVLRTLYTPLNISRHRLGLGFTYHASWLHTIGMEHTLVAEVEYSVIIPDKFMLHVETGYMHKWQLITIEGGSTIVMDNPSLTMAIKATKIFARQWFLGLELSSYELFRYPLFAQPAWTFDLWYRSKAGAVTRGLFAGLALTIRYSDMFTLTSYPDNFIIRLAFGMEFQP